MREKFQSKWKSPSAIFYFFFGNEGGGGRGGKNQHLQAQYRGGKSRRLWFTTKQTAEEKQKKKYNQLIPLSEGDICMRNQMYELQSIYNLNCRLKEEI